MQESIVRVGATIEWVFWTRQLLYKTQQWWQQDQLFCTAHTSFLWLSPSLDWAVYPGVDLPVIRLLSLARKFLFSHPPTLGYCCRNSLPTTTAVPAHAVAHTECVQPAVLLATTTKTHIVWPCVLQADSALGPWSYWYWSVWAYWLVHKVCFICPDTCQAQAHGNHGKQPPF